MHFTIDENIPFAEAAFGSLGDVTRLKASEITNERLRNTDALIVRSPTTVNRSLLEGTPVRFVGTTTIGTDHLDLEYLAAVGLEVAAAPGCNSNSVKEYIVAALLHMAQTAGAALKGRTLGVIGVGNVGSKVVAAGQALGMSVLENDPPLARATGDRRFVSLDDALQADVITVHVPLVTKGMDPTRRLFDRARFDRVKPGALFMNTSRGAVVDTDALREAIRERKLSHTVIDVWEHEPNIDPQLSAEVSIGTAHIAGHSLEGKVNGLLIVRAALCRFLDAGSDWDPGPLMGIPPGNVITVPAGTRSEQEALDRIVSSCYDIAYDHQQLRQVMSRPVAERCAGYSALRARYRIRREFGNYSVHLPRGLESLRATLLSLGFKSATAI